MQWLRLNFCLSGNLKRAYFLGVLVMGLFTHRAYEQDSLGLTQRQPRFLRLLDAERYSRAAPVSSFVQAV